MSICFGFVTTYNQAMAVRFLLGLFEAGMLPGIAYYMSRWYRKAELAFRLALYVGKWCPPRAMTGGTEAKPETSS